MEGRLVNHTTVIGANISNFLEKNMHIVLYNLIDCTTLITVDNHERNF